MIGNRERHTQWHELLDKVLPDIDQVLPDVPPDSRQGSSTLPRRPSGLPTSLVFPRTGLAHRPSWCRHASPEPRSFLPAMLSTMGRAGGPQPGRERPERLGQHGEPGHHLSRSAPLPGPRPQATVTANSLSHGGRRGSNAPPQPLSPQVTASSVPHRQRSCRSSVVVPPAKQRVGGLICRFWRSRFQRQVDALASTTQSTARR